MNWKAIRAAVPHFDAGFNAGWEAAIEEVLVLMDTDDKCCDIAPFVRALAQPATPAEQSSKGTQDE